MTKTEYDPIGSWDGWIHGVRLGIVRSILPGDMRVLKTIWDAVKDLDTNEAKRVREEMKDLPDFARKEIGVTA